MFKKIFITGVVAIVPVVLTIYVVFFLFSFINDILGNYINRIIETYSIYPLPAVTGVVLGIIATILVIFLVGVITHLTRMRLFRLIERMFFNWPLVNKIYFPIKKVVHFLFYPPNKTFKRAVLVEYPRRGIYAIGFLTNEGAIEVCRKTGKKLFNVFLPSSPSPITGFTLIVEESEITFLDMGVENAMKLIASGGLLNPEDAPRDSFEPAGSSEGVKTN